MNMEREGWWEEWFEREGKEIIEKTGHKWLQRLESTKNIIIRNMSCSCKHRQDNMVMS